MSTVIELSEPGPGDGLRMQIEKDQPVRRQEHETLDGQDVVYEQEYVPSGRTTSDGIPIYTRNGLRHEVLG